MKWDQPTPPGGEEPEYPAPELALGDADSGDHVAVSVPQAATYPTTDNSSRWLAGAALVVAAAALVVSFVGRRRA